MKFKNIIGSLLMEASKKDVLIKKLGVNEYNADALSEIAGPLAVFFAYKILEKYEYDYYDGYDKITKTQVEKKNAMDRFSLVNGSNSFVKERNKLRGIMDWVRAGLNGNLKPYESLSFDQLYEESEKWHESLGIGEQKIDYIEKHDVILDYREGKEGFYWVNLGAQQCPEEAERMGHCARSNGTLYSLRQYKEIPNNHTLNKSHLTASITPSGELLQLKGAKNSKPGEEYHKYILPLFYFKTNAEEYLIDSIGYEYNSSNDFKIGDLTEDEVKKLYSDRPDLFNGRQEKKILKKLGLISGDAVDYKFTLFIGIKYVEDYVRGEYNHIIKDILNGDTYQYWDNYEYADWKSAIQYNIDEANTQRILTLLKEKFGANVEEGDNLTDLIEEYDENEEIKHALRSSINDAEAQDYENYLYKKVKAAFEEYGNVTEMDDRGVTIEVDLEQLIQSNGLTDEDVDDISERCENSSGTDVECIFSELLGEGLIEKPEIYVDDRWYPDVDNDNFNEILNDRLYEI